MKIHCRSCGCHFDDDFEETLQPECNMWRERGFHPEMSVEHKRAIWDSYFGVPVDEIADETSVVTNIDIRATPGMSYDGNQFEAIVPGYVYMTDRQKRDFQKCLFKFRYNQPPAENMEMYLKWMGLWDQLVAMRDQGQEEEEKTQNSVDTETI